MRDLRGVLEREKAEMACLITLQKPTRLLPKKSASPCLPQGKETLPLPGIAVQSRPPASEPSIPLRRE